MLGITKIIAGMGGECFACPHMIFAFIWHMFTGKAGLQTANRTKPYGVLNRHRALFCLHDKSDSEPLPASCARSACGSRRDLKLTAVFGNGTSRDVNMVVRQSGDQFLVRHGVNGILRLDHDSEPLLDRYGR